MRNLATRMVSTFSTSQERSLSDTMETSLLQVAALVLTCVVFGTLGYLLAGRFGRPVALPTWVAIVLLTFFAQFFAISAWLISIDGFHIQLNTALQALGIGILTRLIVREIRIRRSIEARSSIR